MIFNGRGLLLEALFNLNSIRLRGNEINKGRIVLDRRLKSSEIIIMSEVMGSVSPWIITMKEYYPNSITVNWALIGVSGKERMN